MKSLFRYPVKKILPAVIIVLAAGLSCANQQDNTSFDELEAYARIEEPARDEVSGIVKSRANEDVYWVHGDSGTEAAIFPISKDGSLASKSHNNGVELDKISNNDWEEIATDELGNLIVADIGNNCLCRDDLSLIYFTEPTINQEEINNYRRAYIRYPLSSGQSPPDAEAAFYHHGSLYIIIKVDVSKETHLYSLSWPAESNSNNDFHTLTQLDSFYFDDQVTAADISENGDSLAVLTSSSIWLFTGYEGEDFFAGNSKKRRFEAEQVESVAFTGTGSLIIAEEEGELYEIDLSDLK